MLTSTSQILIYSIFFLWAVLTVNANQDDYVYYPDLKIHYKLHKTPKKWIDAKITCSSENAIFAVPANEEQHSVLLTLFKSIQNTETAKKVDTRNMYLGFHDLYEEGNFVTDSGIPLQYYYHTFAPGQPDNYKKIEHCGALLNDGKLNDVSCNSEKVFVCQKQNVSFEAKHFTNFCQNDDPEYKLEPSSGKYFKLHMQPKNWNQARELCQAENSRLALIESKQEEDFLVNIFNDPKNRIKTGSYNQYAHLGYHDMYKEGQFYTVTGEPFSKISYMRWANKQPDNYKGHEHCGSMTSSGSLNDLTCSYVTVFFCEKSTVFPIDVRLEEQK